MPDTSRMIPFVSAATLALVISQGVVAETQAPAASPEAAPPASEPAAASTEAPAAPQAPEQAAPSENDERRAAMMAEREKRYEELRARAAEIGLALPETSPWESAESSMPSPPAMPERRGMSPEDMEAMREQRRAMREQMMSMTPEERRAMRDAHWQQMRADAAERGIEMPETPPWAAAEQRRKEMEEKFEQYRKTVEAMSEEQIEAARALFGGPPPMPEFPSMPPHMPPQGYGYGPQGGYPGGMPYQGGPGGMGMGQPPMMPSFGPPGSDQGPPQGGSGN
jgi:hypothetical protein